jgi:hypothetical protein
MPAHRVHTEKQVLAALRKEKCLVVNAARRLGVHRNTMLNYAREYPSVRKAIDEYRLSLKDAREALADLAEEKLFELIANDDKEAMYYALNKLGWGRGYAQPKAAGLPEGMAIESWSVTVVNRGPNGELAPEAEILSSRALVAGAVVTPSSVVTQGGA